MLIKDLPIEIQEIVFKRQIEQGNPRNDELDLGNGRSNGNFNWDDTIEGDEFWENIYDGDFSEFYEKYPKKEESKSLVGRYLKILVDGAHGTNYKKDDYAKIVADDLKGYVKCSNNFTFGSNGYDWKSCNVEIMPEGFVPPTSTPVVESTNNEFKKGDYIVIVSGRENLDYIVNNYCYKQYENHNYLIVEIDNKGGGKTRASGVDFNNTNDRWRYATPEEIAEYDRLGKPYDVTTLIKKDMKTKFKLGDKVKIINRHPDNTTGSLPFDKQSGMIAYVCHQDHNHYALTSNKNNSGDYYGLLKINNQSNFYFKDSDLELITESVIEEPKPKFKVGDKIITNDKGWQFCEANHPEALSYCKSTSLYRKIIEKIIWSTYHKVYFYSLSDTNNLYSEDSLELDIETTSKFEVGKWYKYCNWYIKYSHHSPTGVWVASEKIDDSRKYSKKESNFGGDNDKELLTDLSEIQQYLPEGHPDKIIKQNSPYSYTTIKNFKELEEGGIYYVKLNKAEYIFEFKYYETDIDDDEFKYLFDNYYLDLHSQLFECSPCEPYFVEDITELRDVTEDEIKWFIACKRENEYIEKSVAIQKYDSYNHVEIYETTIELNEEFFNLENKFKETIKNKNQSFKIKTKNSLLDTSIEKVPTITTELKQKSKTIKF